MCRIELTPEKDLSSKLAKLKLEYYTKLEPVRELRADEKADRAYLTTLVLIHQRRYANQTRPRDLQQA
jgi:hypothetical protein